MRISSLITFAILMAACGAEAPAEAELNESSSSEASGPSSSPPTARCDTLSSFGPELLATRQPDQVSGHVGSDDLLLDLGGRCCVLIEPLSFNLKGCTDWYDCGGCLVEVREQFGGTLTVEGHSDRPECRDLSGRFAFVSLSDSVGAGRPDAGLECDG
jgi:hypothetical protein